MLADGIERDLRLALLHEADDGVDQHDAEDDETVDPVAERRRHGGRREQHVDQEVVELEEEARERPALPRRGKAVRAVFQQPVTGLLRGQTAGRRAVKLCQQLVRRPGVPIMSPLRSTQGFAFHSTPLVAIRPVLRVMMHIARRELLPSRRVVQLAGTSRHPLPRAMVRVALSLRCRRRSRAGAGGS